MIPKEVEQDSGGTLQGRVREEEGKKQKDQGEKEYIKDRRR
jgi:hypothetical protein